MRTKWLFFSLIILCCVLACGTKKRIVETIRLDSSLVHHMFDAEYTLALNDTVYFMVTDSGGVAKEAFKVVRHAHNKVSVEQTDTTTVKNIQRGLKKQTIVRQGPSKGIHVWVWLLFIFIILFIGLLFHLLRI